MAALVKHRGLVAFLDAAVWREGHPVFLSLVGSREAVRGILAALLLEEGITLVLPEATLSLSPRGKGGSAVTRVRGGYHGVFWEGEPGGYYVARKEDPHLEALWASRALGKPIPPSWWPALRPRLLLPSHGAVGLRPPEEGEYWEMVRGAVGRGGRVEGGAS